MVKASHWSSESYRLYTCVTFALPSQSMQLNGQGISLVIRRLQVVHICNLHSSSQSMQLNGQNISLVIRRLQVVHIYVTGFNLPSQSMYLNGQSNSCSLDINSQSQGLNKYLTGDHITSRQVRIGTYKNVPVCTKIIISITTQYPCSPLHKQIVVMLTGTSRSKHNTEPNMRPLKKARHGLYKTWISQ